MVSYGKKQLFEISKKENQKWSQAIFRSKNPNEGQKLNQNHIQHDYMYECCSVESETNVLKAPRRFNGKVWAYVV